MAACLKEVDKELKLAARGIPKSKARERQKFMKAAMPMHGLTVPVQRKVLKRGYSFSDLGPTEQFPIWDHIWFNARSHEAKMQAIFFLNGNADGFDAKDLWNKSKSWANHVNCWDQADELAKRYSYLFEELPGLVYPTYKKWNKDADPWKRRLSVVGLFCYASLHKKHPPLGKVLPLVRQLLDDEDRYVQKGVGWTLREAFNVYPEPTFDFVYAHGMDIHSEAFFAATEKMTKEQKTRIKTKRTRRRR